MEQVLGLAPRRGYTLGPAFVWEGWPSAERLYHQGMPVILIASYLEERMLENLDLTRVRGIALERASPLDPVWDKLAETARPSLVGAAGILQAVRPGDTVIVDGHAARAIVRPDAPVERRFARLRGTHPPHEPDGLREVLARLVGPIRQQWEHRGRRLPFDVPEQRRLYEMAWRLAEGALPSAEDDALVARLLFEEADRGGARGFWEPGAGA